jgi:hypothetical protein
MGFRTELRVREDGKYWRVLEPLEYKGNIDLFVVPPDFSTDFASVPKLFQWLLPKTGRYTKAAVLHDYLSRLAERRIWEDGRPRDPQGGGPRKLNRSDADGIFRRVMAELGVSFLQRWLMWGGVRWPSLGKSGFKDGPEDLPRLILLTVPGLFVGAGGVVVLVFLLAFFILENVTALILALLKLFKPIRDELKPVNRPKVLLSR